MFLFRKIRREMILNDESSSSDDDSEQREPDRVQTKLMRDQSDPFRVPEDQFRRTFRLSRSAAKGLLDEILASNPSLRNIYSNSIPFHLRMLGALNFFGTGSYQKRTGCSSDLFYQSQSSMSRSLSLVVQEILKLAPKYIQFPNTALEVESTKATFMSSFGMPGIVGVIDGTHISIIQPSVSADGCLYYNSKRFCSINVLVACDANQKILYANANHPGSLEDFEIWQMSRMEIIEHCLAIENTFMLGDSGFPAEKCLLTPARDAAPGLKTKRYNNAHKSTWTVIESCIGVLKKRFQCLTRDKVLHYSPEKAGTIIYACLVLHNICIMQNIALDNDDNAKSDIYDKYDNDEINTVSGTETSVVRQVRNKYIESNF